MLVSLLPQLGVGHPAVKDCSYRASIDIGQYCSDSPSIFADSVEGKDGDDATAACQTICKRRPSCMYASIWPSEANKGSQKWCRLTESCEAVWPDPAGNGVAIFTCSPPSPPPLPLPPPPPKACSKREESNGDYCGDSNPVFSNFVDGYDTKTVCRNMCDERPECNFASVWPSRPSEGGLYGLYRGWCRLTSNCPGFWPDPAGNDVAVFSCSSRAPLLLPPPPPPPPPSPLPAPPTAPRDSTPKDAPLEKICNTPKWSRLPAQCHDTPIIFAGFMFGQDAEEQCRSQCEAEPECFFFASWEPYRAPEGSRAWCKLTRTCDRFLPDQAAGEIRVFRCTVDLRSPSPPPNPLPPPPPSAPPYPPMPAQFASLGLSPRLLDERGRGRLAVRC